jgi:gliding motility-associated-like protein
MRKLQIIVYLILASYHLNAQKNLVPNPGFDSPCSIWSQGLPISLFPSEYGLYWIGDGGNGIILDSCQIIRPDLKYPYSVPPTADGLFSNYQPALSLYGYGVISVYGRNYRNYLISPLTNTLEEDKAYLLRFYVSPLYPDERTMEWIYNDAVGMTLTPLLINYGKRELKLGVPNPYFNIKPIIENKGKLLTDTVNWIKIQGKYVAKGNEKYVVIGNFRKDDETMLKRVNPNLFTTIYNTYNNFFLVEDAIVSPFNPLPDTVFLCPDSTVRLNASFYDASYKWNTGATDSILTVKKAGLYTVTATFDDFSFSDTVRVITEKEYPGLPKDTTICKNRNTIKLSMLKGFDYRWSTGATNNAIEVKEGGTYTVTVTTPQCQLQFSTTVNTENCQCSFYAPNSFSPNDDGTNDNFKPFLNCKLVNPTDYQLLIYNRYGNLVFTTNNPNEAWNGTYLGQPCGDGVFVWQVTYKINNLQNSRLETIIESGDVTIIR